MVSARTDIKHREGYDEYREGYGRSDAYADDLHVSPDLAPLEPLLEVRPGRGGARSIRPSVNRRSVGSEALRLFVFGLIIMTIGGAAFASQYGDHDVKEALGLVQTTISGLVPDLGLNPPARAVEGLSSGAEQPSAPDRAPAKEARPIQSQPGSTAASSSPQLQQQLETVASELAVVRGLAERLSVTQKKMAQDITALESAKDNAGQKAWWLYQSSAFAAPSHKSAKKAPTSTAKPPPAPAPAARPQTP